ncbi:MAG: hypothetical protein DRO87_12070 [Candidatus Thorarchaeota archaeon]|nr:MAG: hypothetical protein DRO87_12070 [Candidatus Thorarchaeota archaeon]
MSKSQVQVRDIIPNSKLRKELGLKRLKSLIKVQFRELRITKIKDIDSHFVKDLDLLKTSLKYYIVESEADDKYIMSSLRKLEKILGKTIERMHQILRAQEELDPGSQEYKYNRTLLRKIRAVVVSIIREFYISDTIAADGVDIKTLEKIIRAYEREQKNRNG